MYEGANEAARRAVNAILDRTEPAGARCAVWPLHEPAIFDRAKQIDERMMGGGAGARQVLDRVPSGDQGPSGLAESLELVTR